MAGLTQGRVADILTMRGQLDEALCIYQQEQLPVYEQLGDLRSRAMVQSKIADILTRRGQRDEALRIHRQEVLPVYEQLGDIRSRAVARGNIAMSLWQRNAEGDRSRAAELFAQALQAARQLQLVEVAAIEAVMREFGLPIPPAAD